MVDHNTTACESKMWRDQTDPASTNALYTLGAITLFVILQGVYTMEKRLKNDAECQRYKIFIFFFWALSCLGVFLVYCFVGPFMQGKCGYYFLQTYPPLAYLIVGATYIQKSLQIQMIDQKAKLKHEVQKQCVEGRFRNYKNAIWCGIAAYIVLYFV